MNSATHFYIRPQNINNESMLKTELDPISLQISTLAFIFLCFFLSCYPHFHLFSFFIMFLFFSIPFFLSLSYLLLFFHHTVIFFPVTFFLLLFFRGKMVIFFPVSLPPSRLLPFFLLLSFRAPGTTHQITSPTMHLSDMPQCTIKNRNEMRLVY